MRVGKMQVLYVKPTKTFLPNALRLPKQRCFTRLSLCKEQHTDKGQHEASVE
jgi:hypothetical protein